MYYKLLPRWFSGTLRLFYFHMITISFYVTLFIYFFFLLAFVIFTMINIGHLISTGTFTTTSFAATFIFIVYTIIILGLTWFQIANIDWQQQVTIWDPAWLRNAAAFNQPV